MSLPRLSPPGRNNLLHNPAALFLMVGLLIGILYCIFIPYGAGFDEETHMVRIMDISGMNLLPNHSKQDKTVTFRQFFDLSYQRRFFQSPAYDLLTGSKFSQKLDAKNLMPVQTRSVYSPVIFFPQALVAKIVWGILDIPIIPGVILQRIAGLLVYLLGAYLTIRLLPFGKWIFTVLALSPMALFQAATLNADGFTNAVCFLFIGMTLYVFASREPYIRPWQVWVLAGLAALIGLAKPGYFPLVLLLLILPLRRFQSSKWIILLAAGALLAVVFTFGWIALTVPKSHFADSGSQSLSKQLGLILTQPVNFVVQYFKGIFSSISSFFLDWVGVYGYWVGEVPAPVYWFYPLLLVAALLLEPPVRWLSWKTRAVMLGLSLISTGFIIFLYYYLHYTPGEINDLGRQGRYFIPTMPLFFLSLTGLLSIREWVMRYARILVMGALFLVIGFYSFGLYAAYYTECGYGIYAGGPCELPVYKNLAKDSALEVKVNQKSVVSQTFTSDCGAVESVQILVKSLPAVGTLRYSVLDGSGKVIATRDFPIARIPTGDYFTLPITPPANANPGAYEIRLESPDIPPPEAIGIAVRPGGSYRDGTLSEAGTPQDGDLIFHYACPNPLYGSK